MMGQLEQIIRDLIETAKTGLDMNPTGLDGGLSIKIKKQPDTWTLAAWRYDKPPSKQELVILIDIIKKIHNPQLIYHSQEPTIKGRVHGYRIHWSAVPLVVSLLRPPTQGRLFEEGYGHNYGEG